MIVNLKNYDLVFTTSFEHTHGVTGHLYEMIDYFYIAQSNGIKCAILLSDGTKIETLNRAITEKYTFDPTTIIYNTSAVNKPGIIVAKQICVVDGASRFDTCTIYADHMWLLKCWQKDFRYFNKHKTIKCTHLLQDFSLYEERYGDLNIDVIDYTKKILWSEYKQPMSVKSNTALFYLTTNCRGLEPKNIETLINKYQFEKYIIATNDVLKYKSLISDRVDVIDVPISNLFEKFDAYIYTAIPGKFDCSPRFIVECAVFGKEVFYEIDYVDPGIECRKKDIKNNLQSLLLTMDDEFILRVKNECKSY